MLQCYRRLTCHNRPLESRFPPLASCVSLAAANDASLGKFPDLTAVGLQCWKFNRILQSVQLLTCQIEMRTSQQMFLHAKFFCIDFQTYSIWEIKSHIFSTRSPFVLQTLLVGGTDPRRFAAWVGASLNLGDVDVTSKKKTNPRIQLWFLVGYKWYKPAREEISIQFFNPKCNVISTGKKKKLPSPRHVQSFLFDVERWPLWTWHGRGSARHSAGDYAAFASLRSAPAWNNNNFPNKMVK